MTSKADTEHFLNGLEELIILHEVSAELNMLLHFIVFVMGWQSAFGFQIAGVSRTFRLRQFVVWTWAPP